MKLLVGVAAVSLVLVGCGDDAPADDDGASGSGGSGAATATGATGPSATLASTGVGVTGDGRPDFASLGFVTYEDDVPPTITGVATVADLYGGGESLAWTDSTTPLVTHVFLQERIPIGESAPGFAARGLTATQYDFWWITADPDDPANGSTFWAHTGYQGDLEPYPYFTDIDGISIGNGEHQVLARRGGGEVEVIQFATDESYLGPVVPEFVAGGGHRAYASCFERYDTETGAAETLQLNGETLAMIGDVSGAYCLVRFDATPEKVGVVQWPLGSTSLRGLGELKVAGLDGATMATDGLHVLVVLHESAGDRLIAVPRDVGTPGWELATDGAFDVLAITNTSLGAGFVAAVGYDRLADDGATTRAASIVRFRP